MYRPNGNAAATLMLDCCPLPGEAASSRANALYVLAGLVTQCHAEACVIAVRIGGGEIVAELAHRDAGLEESARALILGAGAGDRLRLLRSVIESGSDVAVPGPALWLDGETRDARAAQLSAAADGSSWVAVPMRCNGVVIGGIQLLYAGMTTEDARSAADRAVALADRLGCFLARSSVCADQPDAVRTRDEVLALVAHDLRNPLNVVKLSAELMLEQLPSDERFFRQWLGATIMATDRMNQIVGDLLEVSRLEAGQPSILPANTRLDSFLREAVTLYSLQAEQKGIRLELEPVPQEAYVHVDVEALRHVLSNLLDNALHFTRAGGAILIRAERDEAAFRIEVADTGSGIEPEQLPHIFDRFYQARSSHRAGAGLGLAIAKGIVEAHGGRIWATSTPDVGTTFYFTLPAAD